MGPLLNSQTGLVAEMECFRSEIVLARARPHVNRAADDMGIKPNGIGVVARVGEDDLSSLGLQDLSDPAGNPGRGAVTAEDNELVASRNLLGFISFDSRCEYAAEIPRGQCRRTFFRGRLALGCHLWVQLVPRIGIAIRKPTA